MVAGLPGWNEIAIIGTTALFYGAVVAAVIGLLRWFVDRRTAELRQRVALLEHEVAELRESSTERTNDERE